MRKYLSLFTVILIGCSGSENGRHDNWHGTWKAKWETLAESYPEIENKEFYMNGVFTFTRDSLTVLAQGFPSCIFNEDTLSHTQSWYISNDTLFLINDPGLPGMMYLVRSKTDSEIKLQLMKDIFVTLSK